MGGLPRPRRRPVRAADAPRTWPRSSAPPPSTTCSTTRSGTAASGLLVDELRPDEDHSFDIVGVPDLVAEPPDIWTLAELSDTIAILRSLAEVCGLDAIDEVLGSADGFAVLPLGEQAFTGRAGEKLWNELGAVVVGRWDEVLDAIDGIVTTPEVEPDALTTAQSEADAIAAAERAATGRVAGGSRGAARRGPRLLGRHRHRLPGDHRRRRTGWTLRCYLGDDPVFLSTDRRISVFDSPAALEDYVARFGDGSPPGRAQHLGGGADGDPRGSGRRARRAREHLRTGWSRRTAGPGARGRGCRAARPRSRVADRCGKGARRRGDRRGARDREPARQPGRRHRATRTTSGSHRPRPSPTRQPRGRCSSSGSPPRWSGARRRQ